MKKVRINVILIIFFVIFSTASFGLEIDIKGLRIGMSKSEIDKKIGSSSLKEFTISEVPGKYPLQLEFYEDKLDNFMFFFSSKKFEDVCQAVISKYPELKCTNSEITNKIGASFKQVNCQLEDQLGMLTLTRFVTDLNTSVLALSSHRLSQELAKKRKAKQKDI